MTMSDIIDKAKVLEEENKVLAQNLEDTEILNKTYEKRFNDLEKENAELKTKKIPQLERKIASIRGSHRVDLAKLNARIEQVERLKKENAELKDYRLNTLKAQQTGIQKYALNLEHKLNWYDDQLTKAKEIIKYLCGMVRELNKPNVQLTNVDYSLAEAEQFLKDSEVEK